MKIYSFAIFPHFFDFLSPDHKLLFRNLFVSQIFSSLNPFVPGGTKCHSYLNEPASKGFRLV